MGNSKGGWLYGLSKCEEKSMRGIREAYRDKWRVSEKPPAKKMKSRKLWLGSQRKRRGLIPRALGTDRGLRPPQVGERYIPRSKTEDSAQLCPEA